MGILIFLTKVVKHEGCCKGWLKWGSFCPRGNMRSLTIFSFSSIVCPARNRKGMRQHLLLRQNIVSFLLRTGNFLTPEGDKWFVKQFHFQMKEVVRGSCSSGDTISSRSLNSSCLNYAKLKLSPFTFDRCAVTLWPVLGPETQTADRAGGFPRKAGEVKRSTRLHCSRCSWIIRLPVPSSATPTVSWVLHMPWRSQTKPSLLAGTAERRSSLVPCKGRGWQMLPSALPLQLSTRQKPQGSETCKQAQ